MKTVELKKDKIDFAGKEKDISTAELIRTVLDFPPKEGFSFQDLKSRRRIDDALEAAGEAAATLQLEDSDYQTLKEAALQMRWIWRGHFIENFVASVTA